MRGMGGLVLRAEARSVVVLPTSLKGSFIVDFHEVHVLICWLAVAAVVMSSWSLVAALLVTPQGPAGQARETAPLPRAEPLPVPWPVRRGRATGTRASSSTLTAGAMGVHFTVV